MLIAIAIAYKLNSATSYLFSTSCTPNPGFACGYYSINENGILEIGIQQAIGSAIMVNGVACATNANTNGQPLYGNVNVANSVAYYPATDAPTNEISIQSGGQYEFTVYCYGSGNSIETSTQPGSAFVGYVWINYTIQNTNIHNVQQFSSLGLEYIAS